MLFVISEELRNLAELFHKKKNSLYIVGGFVRNKLLGIPDCLNLDIDLCSSATPSEVEKYLKNTEFDVEEINKNFGVVRIKGKYGSYEHATFRTEKYDFAGIHSPSNVEFIDSLENDSIRRDFRCNAVYYDIYKDELIDPLGGLKDIKKRLIRTTRDPKIVFNDDSERILRMIRQASCLGFSIEKSTYESAKANSFKVQFLTKTRIRHEFEKIITADTFYPCLSNTKQAHKRGIQMLVELDVLKYILPTLSKISKLDIRDDMSRNLFNHIVEVFENCKESDLELRYAILMHDYGKAEALIQNKSFFGHENLTNSLIENELGDAGLMYNKRIINNIKTIIHGVDFKPQIFDPVYKIRKFIIENNLQINNIITLKKYIFKNKNKKFSRHLNIVVKEFEALKNGEYPLNIDDLEISGKQIIELYPNIKKDVISKLLNDLFELVIKGKCKNSFINLSNKLKQIVQKKQKAILEV